MFLFKQINGACGHCENIPHTSHHSNMQAEIQFAVYNLTDNTGTHIALFTIIKKNVDTLGATRA